jgi:hypothetical protein
MFNNFQEQLIRVEQSFNHKLDNLSKEIHMATQAITDLTAAVNAAISEVQTLVIQLQAALANSSAAEDAAVEALVTQLNTVVTGAQQALSSSTVTAPTSLATVSAQAAGTTTPTTTPTVKSDGTPVVTPTK